MHFMKYLILALSLMLGGCVTLHNPIPKDYSGSLANVHDSFKVHSSRSADIFYIKQINNKDVINAFWKTNRASIGQNGQLMTQGHSHRIPTRKNKLLLSGETTHGAPIGYVLNAGSNYVVQGELEFTAEKDKHYLISGELSKKRSAVWIEDIDGNIVSDVIEIIAGSEKSTIVSANEYNKVNNRTHKQIRGLKDRVALFSNITMGENIDLVEAKIGAPDKISYDKGNFLTGRKGHFDHLYDGLGKIRFNTYGKSASTVLKVFPEIADNDQQMAYQLNTSGQTLQHIAREYYKKNSLSQVELDQIAFTIWKNRNTNDDYTEDAVAWLIKVIGKQGNNRYYSLINTLSDRKQFSYKITRYAVLVLDQLNPSSINQFEYLEGVHNSVSG
jgi:hypothetical protein